MSKNIIAITGKSDNENIIIAYIDGGNLITIKDLMCVGGTIDKIKPHLNSPRYEEYTAEIYHKVNGTVSREQVPTVGLAVNETEEVTNVMRSIEEFIMALDTADEALYNHWVDVYQSVGVSIEQLTKIAEDYKFYVQATKDKSLRIAVADLEFTNGTLTVQNINNISTTPESSVVMIGYEDRVQETPNDLLDFRLPTIKSLKTQHDITKLKLENNIMTENITQDDLDDGVDPSIIVQIAFLQNQAEPIGYPMFDKIADAYEDKHYLRFIGWKQYLGTHYRGFDTRKVTGFSEMNDTPIMENEEPMFNKLVELMYKAYEEEGLTKEQADEKVNSGILPTMVSSYFRTLIELALYQTRIHTGQVKASTVLRDLYDDVYDLVRNTDGISPEEFILGLGIKSKEEGGKAVEASGMGSNEETLERVGRGAAQKVYSFITSKAHCLAWVEAIIKLLRWGENKPRMLKLDYVNPTKEGETVYEYLDLETFKEMNFGGDYSKLTPKVIDGCDKFITAVVTSDIRFETSNQQILANMGYNQKYSSLSEAKGYVGVQVTRYFEGNDLTLTQFIDIITFVDMIKRQQDGNKIYGVSCVDGKIKVSDSVYTDLNFHIERNGEEVTKFYFHPNVKRISMSEAIVQTMVDIESTKFQPSRCTISLLNDLDVTVPSPYTTQKVSLIPVWNTFATSQDLTEIFEYSTTESEAEIKMKAVEQMIDFEQAILRKCTAELGDTLLQLNAITEELTDEGLTHYLSIPLEEYLNRADYILNPSSQPQAQQSVGVASVAGVAGSDMSSFQVDKDRIKMTQSNTVSKTKVIGIKILTHVIGYIEMSSPKVIKHKSMVDLTTVEVLSEIDANQFIAIYNNFSQQTPAVLQEYDYNASLQGMHLIGQDYQSIASGNYQG